ncbi:uncharacterized protein LOC144053201 [Vanacampus margaritifer]
MVGDLPLDRGSFLKERACFAGSSSSPSLHRGPAGETAAASGLSIISFLLSPSRWRRGGGPPHKKSTGQGRLPLRLPCPPARCAFHMEQVGDGGQEKLPNRKKP